MIMNINFSYEYKVFRSNYDFDWFRCAARIIHLKSKNYIFRHKLTHNNFIGRPGHRAILDTKAFPTKAILYIIIITHTSL